MSISSPLRHRQHESMSLNPFLRWMCKLLKMVCHPKSPWPVIFCKHVLILGDPYLWNWNHQPISLRLSEAPHFRLAETAQFYLGSRSLILRCYYPNKEYHWIVVSASRHASYGKMPHTANTRIDTRFRSDLVGIIPSDLFFIFLLSCSSFFRL